MFAAFETKLRRSGDAAGALVILRGMSKAGISLGEHSLAATMEAFATVGDVEKVLALMKVDGGYFGMAWFGCVVI